MALDGVLSSGLTAIQTNSAALRVTSANIANVNTPGYSRRVAQMATLAPGGQLAGVTLADVQRVVSNYLDKEVLSASASAGRYDVQSSMMQQLNAALGQPGDGASVGSKLDALYSALGQASLDPSSLATRLGALNSFDSVARSISDISGSVANLRTSADEQVSNDVTQVNTLVKQLYDLNAPIQHATVNGDSASGLLDQRDQLLQKLSQLIDVRTVQQADGRMFVSTADGVQLIGDTYSQLSYTPSAGPSFKPITLQTLNAQTGLPIGNPMNFDAHIGSGELRGLLDMRDNTLVGLGQELGALAQTLALSFNQTHNAGSAVPPPTSMNGRETGLLGTDALNFTGKTTIGIANSTGALQHKIAIDFGAGTLSVDGGGPVGIGTTIDSFTTALNTAMGANGTASFADGALSLTAAGGNGLVIADDATTPAARGGVGFSQFFGLNDLYQANASAIQTTGLSASDTGGFAPGGAISLLLKGPQGQRVNEVTVNVTGTTIGDMVTALNTAFTGNATFALDANGQLQMTPAGAYSGYSLEVTSDSTLRGTTGQSFTSLFGIGTGQALARAQGFSLNDDMVDRPELLAFAQSSLTGSTALGTNIVSAGDNRGLMALQDLINQPHGFVAAGALPARSVTFTDYTAALYQDVSSRANTIDAAKSAQDTRLQLAQQNQSTAEGVNLDEELAHMMVLQQAYNAGARLISVSKELYDELLKAVGG